MAFTRTTRAQLANVVVVLHKRNQTREQVPLHAGIKMRRLHPGGAQQHIQPLILGKLLPCLHQGIHIHIRHLDRLQFLDGKRRTTLAILVIVLDGDN